jgi:hypothetical protein
VFNNILELTHPSSQSTSQFVPKRQHQSLELYHDDPSYDEVLQSPTPKRQRRKGLVGNQWALESTPLTPLVQTQNDFLHNWKHDHRQQYLTELLRLEAAPTDRNCSLCHDCAGSYRCIDCGMAEPLLCEQCCVRSHQGLPFHRIQHWTGKFFAPHTLDDLGLVIHMGHDGAPCPMYCLAGSSTDQFSRQADDNYTCETPAVNEEDTNDDILLGTWTSDKNVPGNQHLICVDVTGVHHRQVKWCLCPNAPEQHIQLFRMRLFSASQQRPSTAFTFNVLDMFYVEAMECKTAALNFFAKLQRLTNNAFPSSVPVC